MGFIAFLMSFLTIVSLMLGLKGLAIFFGLQAGLVFVIMACSAPNIKENCPYCGTLVTAHSFDPGVDCPGCKKRLLIRDKKLVTIE